MKWVYTTNWLIKPNTKYSFRIGNGIYHCYFSFWRWALIKKVGEVTGARERGMR